MSGTLRCAGCILLEFVLISSSAAGADNPDRSHQLSKLRQLAVRTTDRRVATVAYLELFENISDDELDDLKDDPDTGIGFTPAGEPISRPTLNWPLRRTQNDLSDSLRDAWV